MRDTEEYFNRIRDMHKAFELECQKLKALEENAYSLGGNNFNRVSSTNSKDFTYRVDIYLDRQYYDHFKNAGLKDYCDKLKATQDKLNELKNQLSGLTLVGLYVCDLMYLHNMKLIQVEQTLNHSRSHVYASRKAFFDYCDRHKVFEEIDKQDSERNSQ